MKNSNTKIYWLYNVSPEKLISMGVCNSSIFENITDHGLLQCEMTQEQAESLIPKETLYCYHGKYMCPFHDTIPHFPKQDNGYCHFLKRGDPSFGLGLLWDSCKECNIGTEFDYEEIN